MRTVTMLLKLLLVKKMTGLMNSMIYLNMKMDKLLNIKLLKMKLKDISQVMRL